LQLKILLLPSKPRGLDHDDYGMDIVRKKVKPKKEENISLIYLLNNLVRL